MKTHEKLLYRTKMITRRNTVVEKLIEIITGPCLKHKTATVVRIYYDVYKYNNIEKKREKKKKNVIHR